MNIETKKWEVLCSEEQIASESLKNWSYKYLRIQREKIF